MFVYRDITLGWFVLADICPKVPLVPKVQGDKIKIGLIPIIFSKLTLKTFCCTGQRRSSIERKYRNINKKKHVHGISGLDIGLEEKAKRPS